jgi:hypothetical protein
VEGLVVEPVELALAADSLLTAEDADPKLQGRLDLGLVDGRANLQGSIFLLIALIRSIGNGKTIVVALLVPISSSVCR